MVEEEEAGFLTTIFGLRLVPNSLFSVWMFAWTSWTLAAPGMPAQERGRPVTLLRTTVEGLGWSLEIRESSIDLLAETALPMFGMRTDGVFGFGFSSPNSRSIHRLAEVFRGGGWGVRGVFFSSSLEQRCVVFDLV